MKIKNIQFIQNINNINVSLKNVKISYHKYQFRTEELNSVEFLAKRKYS